jgi:hypothetical protein
VKRKKYGGTHAAGTWLAFLGAVATLSMRAEMGTTVIAKSSVTNGICDAMFSVRECSFSDAKYDGEQSERSGQFHG